MARALLDINVVIALLDQGHVLHQAATQWLAREQGHGWATCPITENGVVRIMAQPAYPNHQPAARVADRLALAATHGGRFVTFDQRIELDLVPGAVAANLCILGAG